MPGIVALAQLRAARLDLAAFHTMLDHVNPRKRYHTAIHIDTRRHYALGELHLPTVQQGHDQPFFSPDGHAVVLLHGELYNSDLHHHSPTEYIYHLYRTHGARFAANLNGSFLVAIADGQSHQLLIANDRTASRPFFYHYDHAGFHGAPELKALLSLPHVKTELNPAAVASFLASGYLLAGQTWATHVRLLDNATTLILSDEGVQFLKYWSFGFPSSVVDKGPKHYEGALRELIPAAVQRRMRTPHRYGVLLSGGYDSRGILGCVLHRTPPADVHTISWGVDENLPYSDALIAKRLARRVGTHHTFYKLDAGQLPLHVKEFVRLSDGLTDACTNYPEALRVFARIRDELGVQVILRGDECFGWISPAFDEASMFQTLGVCPLAEISTYRHLIPSAALRKLTESLEALLAGLSRTTHLKNVHDRKDFFYLDQRLQHYLHPLNYVKSLELEVRNPFLDNAILDFVMELPSRYRIGKTLYRRTIRSMFPSMFAETAYQSGDIDFAAHIGAPTIAEFILKEFSANPWTLEGLIDQDRLHSLLAEFTHLPDRRLKRYAMRAFAHWPEAYVRFKQTYTDLRARATGCQPSIPKDIVVRRLLTLKIWCDEFFLRPV